MSKDKIPKFNHQEKNWPSNLPDFVSVTSQQNDKSFNISCKILYYLKMIRILFLWTIRKYYMDIWSLWNGWTNFYGSSNFLSVTSHKCVRHVTNHLKSIWIMKIFEINAILLLLFYLNITKQHIFKF